MMHYISSPTLKPFPLKPACCLFGKTITQHNDFHPILPSATTHHQAITHSTQSEKVEIIRSLESWAAQSVLPIVKPVEQCWQPSDFLPNTSQPYDQFAAEVQTLRDQSANLPDEYLVVLVGNMITEEALPTYETAINTHDGIRDETGASANAWATWTRAWTAEENRHGDLLRTYLYLTGRVDMRMVEKTVQYLIGSGTDLGTGNDPYSLFVYTSFQERATFKSHGNTGRLAMENGDPLLARICGIIASDEKRHEKAYSKIVGKLLEVDPTSTILAIEDMMRARIKVPSYLMYDSQDTSLFSHYSAVLQRLGIFSTSDYADLLEHFIGQWRLDKLEGLTSEGRCAQEYVCELAPKIRKFREISIDRARKMDPLWVKFQWIFNKEVMV